MDHLQGRNSMDSQKKPAVEGFSQEKLILIGQALEERPELLEQLRAVNNRITEVLERPERERAEAAEAEVREKDRRAKAMADFHQTTQDILRALDDFEITVKTVVKQIDAQKASRDIVDGLYKSYEKARRTRASADPEELVEEILNTSPAVSDAVRKLLREKIQAGEK